MYQGWVPIPYAMLFVIEALVWASTRNRVARVVSFLLAVVLGALVLHFGRVV